MSLLADCCAGDSLVRVTDRSAAYATLAGLLTESTPPPTGVADVRESLLALTLKVADADRIPLAKWIQFREREIGAADGHNVRDLRHRFVEKIEAQVKKIAGAKSGAERMEIETQIQEDMRDDYKALREALKLEAWQLRSTKETLVSRLRRNHALGGIALNT